MVKVALFVLRDNQHRTKKKQQILPVQTGGEIGKNVSCRKLLLMTSEACKTYNIKKKNHLITKMSLLSG